MSDELTIRYVPLDQMRRWDANPKRHDMGALAASIARHGFKMPPRYEPALNGGEGGIVAGNGRADVLSMMRANGQPAPRGIRVEGGQWYVPVLFGVDSESQAAAEAFGLDDNNLTMAGGDFTDLDMARMWEPAGYAALLADLAQQGETPVSIDETALDALLAALAGDEGTLTMDDAFGALPDGDRAPFQQMTFTVSDGQAETIKDAMNRAKSAGPFGDTGNENSNGNALARLAEAYLGIS